MELANSKFGSELSNNYYGADAKPAPKLIAIATTTTIKPVSTTLGKTGPIPLSTAVLTGSGFRPTGTTTTTPTGTTTTTSPSAIPPATVPGGGGGSGGGGGTAEEKAVEEKATETTATAKELTFFQKPIGKVSILIVVAALLYGGYRVMKSK